VTVGDLLHCDVVTRDGARVGRVFDLTARRTGPQVSELQGRAPQIEELFVGPRAFALRLGYKSREMTGPPGLRLIAARLKGWRVPWDAVDTIEDDVITLMATKAELQEL
jgi:sporulation protein YlmC with PRC-barrel domain